MWYNYRMPKQPKYENEPHRLAFIDIETTGLDPQCHEPWEIALILEDVDAGGAHAIREERLLYPYPQNLGIADAKALEISGYYDRRQTKKGTHYVDDEGVITPSWHPGARVNANEPALIASALAPALVGVHMIGCTVHFDATFLDIFLRQNGQCPMWNYHLIDATVYAAGRLQLRPPWKSKKVAEQYGVALNDKDAHNALGDAHLARNLYWAAHDLVAA